ncbi:MAG TPA: cytochrome c-type biogenesis protein [Patescibacteria group bacterium]|nr:cytochrome c-type biogenesis protein [Patescibacteria group bacterium]
MKFILLAFLFLSSPAFAVQPDEMLADPGLEARARGLSRQLRCLVCQGEDIDESNAGLAGDIRKLVRERIAVGDTDGEVLDFVQQRYGDYVLMRPPLRTATLLLWGAPLLVLGAGVAIGVIYLRRLRREES